MRIFFDYLFLEYKKSLKVLLKSAVSLVLVLAVTCVSVIVLGYTMFQSQVFRAIDVAVVMPDDASELQMITQFMSAMDSVKSICRFNYMTQEEAMEDLHCGDVQAVISLPENLYEDIYSGDPAQITVYFPEETALNIETFRELLNDGVNMLQSAEAGVFAAKDTAKVYSAKMKQSKIAKLISYTYIECAFDRNEIFNKTVFSPFGEMDLYQYYIAAGMSVILLMWGVNFSFLYQKQSRSVEQKLKVMGLNACSLSLIKVLVMSGVMWILGVGGYSALCLISSLADLSLLWFEVSVLGWMWLAAAALAVYFHLVFSFFGKGFHGSVFILSVNILMILCSGAVIPSAYLPAWAATVGAYMPLNFLNQFCADMMFGTITGVEIAGIVFWILIVFGMGVFFLWKSISPGIRFYLKRG
ncbi:MAG: ABC transporter permease [Ruminococcus sp.]|nr:ABC transporter permease [Ruminococcus sp.]